MDPTITFKSLLRDGGSVGAVIAVVWLFVKYIRTRDKDAKESQAAFTASLESAAEECHQRQVESQDHFRESLDRLVTSNDRNYDRLDGHLQEMRKGVATLLERSTIKDAN